MHAEDFRGDTWKRFEADLKVHLQSLRETNDGVTTDPIKTATIRGQIVEVKRLLDLRKGSSSTAADPFE